MDNNHSEFDNMFTEAAERPHTVIVQKKRKTLRNWLIALGAFLLLVCIAVGAAYAMLNTTYNQIQRVETFDPTLIRPAPVVVAQEESAPINFLLLGSDSRDTTDPRATVDTIGGFRTDTIMVAQISADRQNITVMSIMRDNWVSIQGHGEAKINAAAAFGGIPLSVNTVETFIDTRVDHVAIINFESFKGLTDAVGGVTVNNPIPFTSTHGGFPFAEGSITLNGEQALGFVRERYSFVDGDYQRARNQQLYLKSLLTEMLSKGTMSSPGKLTATFNALKPYLIVDNSLNLTAASSLGLELRNIRAEDITFFTSPTLGTGTSSDGQSIVLPDWASIETMRDAMRTGTLHEYAETAKISGVE